MSHPQRSPRTPRASHLSAILLVAGIVLACKPVSKPSAEDTAGHATEGAAAPKVETFGAKLGDSPEVTLTQVLQAPGDYAGKTVRLEGHVRRACSAKGCWMELAPSAQPDAQGCRVTFKDYGFFVPTDSAGASARVEGEVMLKRVRAAQVRHYEGEGARFASKHEDGSADEVRLVATGVELRR